jgi:hypothetical protein
MPNIKKTARKACPSVVSSSSEGEVVEPAMSVAEEAPIMDIVGKSDYGELSTVEEVIVVHRSVQLAKDAPDVAKISELPSTDGKKSRKRRWK